MGKLGPSQLRSRLAFDWKVIAGMRSPHLEAVHAFASMDEARAGRVLPPEHGDAGRATVIAVEYRLPVPTGPGIFTPSATIWFDLLAGGNYPFTSPVVTCSSRPMPWSPHVHPTAGSVCLGEAWSRAGGRMLAAQLVVHVMHLLNWDEPDRGAHYLGWTPQATRYWRDVLRGRPISPDLEYPTLPADLTHAVEETDSGFQMITSAPSATHTQAGSFRAVASFMPHNDDGFAVVERSR